MTETEQITVTIEDADIAVNEAGVDWTCPECGRENRSLADDDDIMGDVLLITAKCDCGVKGVVEAHGKVEFTCDWANLRYFPPKEPVYVPHPNQKGLFHGTGGANQ